MNRAYITGATGAVGMALIKKLLEEKVRVTVFLRGESPRRERMRAFDRELAAGQLDIVFLGLEELDRYPVQAEAAGAFAGAAGAVLDRGERERRVFYHLGWSGTFGKARSDRDMQRKNIGYTLEAVRLAARLGCGLFVGAGSQAEYGRTEGVLTPKTRTAPENEYGKAKLEAGVRSRSLARELGLCHIWVRILSVYGPYDGEDTMIMSAIRHLKEGERMPLTRGIQTWDYLYSEDAAEALYRLGGGENLHGRIYCLGSGKELPLREYILKLCREMKGDENLLDFGAVPYGPGQVMRLAADIGGLTTDTGFIPEISFEEGIRRTIEWCGKKGREREEAQF